MNSVRIAYIFSELLIDMLLLILAVTTPVYFTPGCYYWSVLFILMFFAATISFTKRVNGWKDFGKVE